MRPLNCRQRFDIRSDTSYATLNIANPVSKITDFASKFFFGVLAKSVILRCDTYDETLALALNVGLTYISCYDLFSSLYFLSNKLILILGRPIS